MQVLVVKHPFGDFVRGDRITDGAAIAAVLAGENSHHVLAAEHPDDAPVEPEPVPTQVKAPAKASASADDAN